MSDAKVVEAKAARIKDWVTNKLRELEEQNAHLKAQNAKASDQMELLRNRLEQLQAFNATTAAATSSCSSKNGKGRSDSMAEVGKTNLLYRSFINDVKQICKFSPRPSSIKLKWLFNLCH